MIAANVERVRMRFWLERLVLGAALGIVVTIVEFAYYLPVLAASSIGALTFASSLFVWCGESILFVAALSAAERCVHERELTRLELAFAIAIAVAVSVVAWHTLTLVLRDHFGVRIFRDYLGTPVFWLVSVLYHSWILLFFGTLSAIAYASRRQSGRITAALRSAELARAALHERLAEANLASLRAHVDPDSIVATLSRLERLYEADPDAAEQLLDELIAFLRAAVAEVRRTDTRAAASAPALAGAHAD